MLLPRFLIMLGVTVISLLVAVACTPNMESEESMPAQPPAPETTSNEAQGGGQVVDITPMSETDLAAQPTGQSQPGAGTTNEGAQEEPSTQQPPSETMIVFKDDTYKFKVSYPANFVFRTQPTEKLAQLKPRPITSFIIMSPVTASSQIVDLEPADLEIRVYAVEQLTSLDNWLASNNLLPADHNVPLKTFQTPHVTGIEICASTMIAPGCSYFIFGNGWVYQLAPATLEGETMINAFMLIP